MDATYHPWLAPGCQCPAAPFNRKWRGGIESELKERSSHLNASHCCSVLEALGLTPRVAQCESTIEAPTLRTFDPQASASSAGQSSDEGTGDAARESVPSESAMEVLIADSVVER